jgi:hypothetical protein
MRHTEVTPEEALIDAPADLLDKLDRFWDLIEDHYEEEWRMEYSGIINLRVDDKLLERILRDNPSRAEKYFGAIEQHNPEYQKYEWVNFPEYLIGLYSIEGVYNERHALVDGPRSYFFDQE